MEEKVDDSKFEELVENYDAVLISTGSWSPEKIEREGMDLNGIYYAVDYIKAYNLYEVGIGELPELQGVLGVIITELSGKRVGVGGDLLLVDLIPIVLEKAENGGVEKVLVMYKGSRKESKLAEGHFNYIENIIFNIALKN